MIALIAGLVLLANPHYPLATVFVREGELWLSELGNATEKRLPSPGLIADSAVLNISRTKVAFTALRVHCKISARAVRISGIMC